MVSTPTRTRPKSVSFGMACTHWFGERGRLWTENTVSPEKTSLHRLHTPETEFALAGVVQSESGEGSVGIAGKRRSRRDLFRRESAAREWPIVNAAELGGLLQADCCPRDNLGAVDYVNASQRMWW